MNSSTTAQRLRDQMAKFSGVVCQGLGKVGSRFVREMVYGIQASGSVKLSEIARALGEPIAVKKTHERLVRQLERERLGEVVQSNVPEYGAWRVGRDTLVVLDISELTKRYACKMQYLCKVRDGSDGEIRPGYWTIQVVATELGGKEIVPLYQRLYSADAPEFESENRELLHAIEAVSGQVGGRGIWVMDRGGDRKELLVPMVRSGKRFIIRLEGDRHLVCGTRTAPARELARTCTCPYAETVTKGKGSGRNVYDICFGYCRVKLPGCERQLWMLVVKGFGEEPLMLLTTEPLRRNRTVLWRVALSYFKRWDIEETIRYLKQSYGIEDVRVLRYRGLQNLYVLVLAASHFACAVLGLSVRLRVMTGHVLVAAKRIFGIPDFMYYAVADGIKAILTRYPALPTPTPTHSDAQLPLFPP